MYLVQRFLLSMCQRLRRPSSMYLVQRFLLALLLLLSLLLSLLLPLLRYRMLLFQ
jgi:hypothetical protein